jgi:hypothetical protein
LDIGHQTNFVRFLTGWFLGVQISKRTYALMQKVDPREPITVSVPTQNSELDTQNANGWRLDASSNMPGYQGRQPLAS